MSEVKAAKITEALKKINWKVVFEELPSLALERKARFGHLSGLRDNEPGIQHHKEIASL